MNNDPQSASRESDAHLAAIIASSDDAIVSKDLNGTILTWNSAAERIFGYTPEEIIGKSILTIIPHDRKNEEVHIIEQLRQGKRVDHFETIRLRKDGRPVDISVTISPIKDASGKVIGASKIARDITEWKRINLEREKLHELGKAMSGELDIQALVQRITDVATELSGAQFGAFFYNIKNSAGESYMLYTLSGVSREHFDKFPMPRNTDVFAPTFKGEGIVRSDDITKDPRYGHNAPRHGMPKGHLPVRSYLAVSVISRGGDVIGGLFFGHSTPGVFTQHAENVVAAIAGNAAVAMDNARLHRELSDNAAMFQQLANSIPQLAWMAKPDGSIYWFNQRWYDFTGMPTGAHEGWENFLHPAEAASVTDRWRMAVAAGAAWDDTFQLRRHDGKFISHLSRALPLRDENGRVTSWFGTNTDVTDQLNLAKEKEKLLHAERQARSEAERVNQMKDEFLATLSHELRTPLNAILGWSHILQRGKQNEETLRQALAVIERNAKAQTQLIEDLLDMSRIVSGKLRLDVQRVDLAAVVDAAVESVKPAVDAKGLRLRKVLDPNAGLVAGDPNRLQQVVWNLLTNAIKFTPRGGRVEVLLERVNSHVEITVTDTGQGIKPDFLPHVFERFQQADASTTRQYGGLGLGLAIVKHLIELHGGQVRVKSAGEGQGATFSIALPLAVTKHERTREHPTSPRAISTVDCEHVTLSGVKVLVVDDEPDARNLIKQLLSDCHAEVETAESAEQALQIFHSFKPGVVISDIGMPNKDGYALMREIRSLPADQGGKAPAIALTAFARTEDRTRAMLAGYQVHIAKPIDPQELLATVASLVGRTGMV